MVSKNPELEQLRALARQRHRAATRKVSRLKSQGVEISGTELDPRRDLSKLKSYNRNQLQAHVNRLDKFTDRGTQYVALGSGEVITGQEWQKYKKPEQTYNRRTNKRAKEVSDVELPSGTTIGRYLKTNTADRRSARSPAVNRPYDPPARNPRDITDRKALKKLTQDYHRRIRSGREAQEVKAARKTARKMLDLIKDPKLASAVNALSDDQFRVLWNYTNFASSVSQDYEAMMKMLTSNERSFEHDVYDQQLEVSNELAEWAKTVKIEPKQTKKRR